MVNCILLVDDDMTTNFLNEELITDLEVAKEVHIAWNGQEALDYLNKTGKFKAKNKKQFPKPNIIFLDINMPLMGGFEFLQHYNKLPKNKRADVLIVFLTTSDSVKDKAKALGDDVVNEFMEKPLRKHDLLNLIKKFQFT